MKRVLPAPLLSLALLVLWLLLNQSMSPSHLLVGFALAVLIPLATRGLRPLPVRVRHPMAILRLSARVAVDAVQSNLHALRLFAWPKSRQHAPGFVLIPLDVRDPNALAVLAMIVCITPGTAWAELSSDHSMLMLHLLELGDEATVVADIKRRYEAPLMEIFE